MIAFRKVKEAYGWLSNMSPHPVNGAEAFFQAMRFADFGVREKIKAEKSPMGAKMVAKKYVDQMNIVPRSDADLFLMKAVLRAKLEAHPELKQALLDTGDAILIEDVTARPNESSLFWGAAKLPDGTWSGQNNLGRLWMHIREGLKESKS